jgi:acyl-CoA reductase-like NAD-dependent aldehyde dehydrogenase
MKTKPENVKRPPEVAAAMRARAASFRRRPWQERKEIVLRIVDRMMWEMSGVMPESCRV